ncbi:MAG: hypothetical protein ACTTJH_03230 [Bacteroidales bacterium]
MRKIVKIRISLILVMILFVSIACACSSWRKSRCGECPRWTSVETPTCIHHI